MSAEIKNDIISKFPTIGFEIFNYLNLNDLKICRTVCKQWKDIVDKLYSQFIKAKLPAQLRFFEVSTTLETFRQFFQKQKQEHRSEALKLLNQSGTVVEKSANAIDYAQRHQLKDHVASLEIVLSVLFSKLNLDPASYQQLITKDTSDQEKLVILQKVFNNNMDTLTSLELIGNQVKLPPPELMKLQNLEIDLMNEVPFKSFIMLLGWQLYYIYNPKKRRNLS